ncbi:hypothetical protein INS49_014743 [Diaporthe citri]|uniref:uncharacterized protein n=1 Tax=Diaporthe citri TaxID=83186 RepID=UPI001C8112F0|nr:uncharacterized protein INS49_014743 [Diaporthe citri]KAG6356869.1 hypothetical protein INS49_014743 [Diaporthe citri]
MYKKRLRSWGCSKYIRTNARPEHHLISWSASGLIIESPDVFRTPETILLGIQDYITERNENENPREVVQCQGTSPAQAHKHTEHNICRETLDAIFSGAKTALDIETFSRSAADFINSVEGCRELLAEHQVEEAFVELRRLPAKIQVLLRDEPHHALHGLFFTIIKMKWDGEDSEPENGILKALLAYIAAFAADSSLAWPEMYPLRRILEGFSRMENQTDLAEVTIKCWSYFLSMTKPPGDETAGGSCVISSFSLPRSFKNTAGRHGETSQSSQPLVPAYERLGIDKRRTYLQRLQREKEGFKRKNTSSQAKAAFKSQRYMACAYEATGLKPCLKLYLDELVKEAVCRAQRKKDLRSVVLRMTRLDHMLSGWGDEENSQYARRNIVMFGGAEYHE